MMCHPAPLFGPAGRGDSFKEQGFKTMDQVPDYLSAFGLCAFEYQCGRGVKVNKATMASLKEKGAAQGLHYSLHAPYYISMASADEEKRLNSLRYLLQSAEALRMLGGNRIIFHCGGEGKMKRQEALALTAETLAAARAALDDAGYDDMYLCPETMGKRAQLGDLTEILNLCKADKRHIPCLDLGHLNSLWQGSIQNRDDYAAIFTQVADALGDERARCFHVHFSQIEYTAAGEKRHLTFAEDSWGPPYRPFVETVAEMDLCPVVICESSGTQTEDAQTMMKYYESYKQQR